MIEDITPEGCMEFAIATEELGADIYTQLAAKFRGNREIAQIFTRLADDEQVHRQQFAELLKKAPFDQGIGSSPEKREFLKAMSLSEFFSHHRGPLQGHRENSGSQ